MSDCQEQALCSLHTVLLALEEKGEQCSKMCFTGDRIDSKDVDPENGVSFLILGE